MLLLLLFIIIHTPLICMQFQLNDGSKTLISKSFKKKLKKHSVPFNESLTTLHDTVGTEEQLGKSYVMPMGIDLQELTITQDCMTFLEKIRKSDTVYKKTLAQQALGAFLSSYSHSSVASAVRAGNILEMTEFLPLAIKAYAHSITSPDQLQLFYQQGSCNYNPDNFPKELLQVVTSEINKKNLVYGQTSFFYYGLKQDNSEYNTYWSNQKIDAYSFLSYSPTKMELWDLKKSCRVVGDPVKKIKNSINLYTIISSRMGKLNKDGTRIVQEFNTSLEVNDCTTGELLATIPKLGTTVLTVNDKNGKYVAFRYSDKPNSLTLYSVNSPKKPTELSLDNAKNYSVTFSNDSNYLFCINQKNSDIVLFMVPSTTPTVLSFANNGVQTKHQVNLTDFVVEVPYKLVVHAETKQLFCTTVFKESYFINDYLNNKIYIWDLHNQKLKRTLTPYDDDTTNNPINTIKLSPDISTLVANIANKMVYIWKINKNGDLQKKVVITKDLHNNEYSESPLRIQFLSNSTHLAVSEKLSKNGLHIFDINTNNVIARPIKLFDKIIHATPDFEKIAIEEKLNATTHHHLYKRTVHENNVFSFAQSLLLALITQQKKGDTLSMCPHHQLNPIIESFKINAANIYDTLQILGVDRQCPYWSCWFSKSNT